MLNSRRPALPEPERNLYDLITRSYLAQFYPPEQYRSTHVLFQADNYRFASNGRVDVSAGWRSLYRQGQGGGEEQADAEPVDLDRLTVGEQGSVSDAGAKREFTKPPTRYAMKTLLKDLAQVAKYVTDPKIKELLLSKDAEKADEAGGIGHCFCSCCLHGSRHARSWQCWLGGSQLGADLFMGGLAVVQNGD